MPGAGFYPSRRLKKRGSKYFASDESSLASRVAGIDGVGGGSLFFFAGPESIGGPVSSAGPDAAPVWFDIAREFTERWDHQQQIRDAAGQPPLYDPYFLSPVLDTFVRALPHTFGHISAPEGTVVRLEISGDAGGTWFLVRTARKWELTLESEAGPAMDVILPQDTAWRMFTKGIDSETAQASALVRGDAGLARSIFRTVSVIG